MKDKENLDLSKLWAKEYLYNFWHKKNKIPKEIFNNFLEKIQGKANKPSNLKLPDIWSVDTIKDDIKWREIEITRVLFGGSEEYFSKWLWSYIIKEQGIDKINQIISNVVSGLDQKNYNAINILFQELGLDIGAIVSNSSDYRWFIDTLINVSLHNPKYRTCISVFFLKYISYILMSNYPIFQHKYDLLSQTKNNITNSIFGRSIEYENNDMKDLMSNWWVWSFKVSVSDMLWQLQNNWYAVPNSKFDSDFVEFETNTKWINSAVDKMIADKKYDMPSLLKDILRSTIVLKSTKDIIRMMYIILANRDRINFNSDDVDMVDIEIEDKNLILSIFADLPKDSIKKQLSKIVPIDIYWQQILDGILWSKTAKSGSINWYKDAKFRITYNIRWSDMQFWSEIIFFDTKSRKLREKEHAHWKKDFIKWFDTNSRMEKLMPEWSIKSLIDTKTDYIKSNIEKTNPSLSDIDQAVFEAKEEIRSQIRGKYMKIIYNNDHKTERYYIHPDILFDDVTHWYFPWLTGPFYIADDNRESIKGSDINSYLKMKYKNKKNTKTFISKALNTNNSL